MSEGRQVAGEDNKMEVIGGCLFFFFFQAEDWIRDLVRSRGLGDVYRGQPIEGKPKA